MPRLVRNALTAKRVERETRRGYHADGNGLYLHVAHNGERYFTWRGTVPGYKTRRERSIGPVRLYSLKQAREIAAEWTRLARAGIDPKEERDRNKRASLTFEQAARKVWSEQIKKHGRSEKYRRDWIAGLESHVFPLIGKRPVNTLSQADVLRVLGPVWVDRPKTARHLRQRLRTVFNWARTAGHFTGENPVTGVEEGLPRHRPKVKHYAALPYQDVPAFMQQLAGINAMSAAAIRFMILTATRSGEARAARWSELDLGGRVWTIPPNRMKAGDAHRVPLSDAALAVLQDVKGLDPVLVFPSRIGGKVMGDNTLSRLFGRLGVPAVPHGMRSSFRDWAEECTAFPHEVKEAALAHTVKSATERAYRRTDLFEKRRELMESWGRFCLSAGQSGEVVELRR